PNRSQSQSTSRRFSRCFQRPAFVDGPIDLRARLPGVRLDFRGGGRGKRRSGLDRSLSGGTPATRRPPGSGRSARRWRRLVSTLLYGMIRRHCPHPPASCLCRHYRRH
ncbi:unnamed protein product, partial [Ectocarpus sp. 12 AP-2014]